MVAACSCANAVVHEPSNYAWELQEIVAWVICGAVLGMIISLVRAPPRPRTPLQFSVRQLLAFMYIAANLLFWWHFFWGDG